MLPGSRVGEFVVLRSIGRGAMGEVFLAEQPALQRRVALKVLDASYSADPTAVQRFRREALLAARLRHASIVPVFAAGEHEGRLYIAMDFIEGRSLDRILGDLRERDQRPDAGLIAAFVRIGIEVAEALHYAHEEGLLHRDVKPGNILLDRRGRAYLGDFGLARHCFDSPLTVSGELLGTPRYMAPEMIDGRVGAVDRRTDVYSMAAALYELATLQPPFAGDGLQEVFARIREGHPRPAEEASRAVPQGLSDLLTRALARDPAVRPATAAEFAKRLRACLRDELGGVAGEASLGTLLGPSRKEEHGTPGPATQPRPAGEQSSHASSCWTARLPGGGMTAAISGLALAWAWLAGVQLQRPRPEELVFGAYPFAFVALLTAGQSVPRRRLAWAWLLRAAAFLTFLVIFRGDAQLGGVLFVLAAGLVALSNVLFDRWLHAGHWALLVTALVPLLAKIVLEASFSTSPFRSGYFQLTGLLSLFSLGSCLAMLPAYSRPETPRPAPVWLARLLAVGLPASTLYLGTKPALGW
jgi:hypothetical protein